MNSISTISDRDEGETRNTPVTLPVELKREIMEMATYRHPRSAPRFTLVSRDVKNWVEQIMYKAILFNAQRYTHNHMHGLDNFEAIKNFMRTAEGRPSSFFAGTVQTLHLNGHFNLEDIIYVLNLCTGVTSLGFYTRLRVGDPESTNQIYRCIRSLRLQRLFISQHNLEGLILTSTSNSSVSQLTHIAVVDGSVKPPEFAQFKALTHLAVVFESTGNFMGGVTAALASPRIAMIVVMVNSLQMSYEAMNLLKRDRITDPRVVVFTLPLGLQFFFEDDVWDLASEFPDEEKMAPAYFTTMPSPRILPFSALNVEGAHYTSKNVQGDFSSDL